MSLLDFFWKKAPSKSPPKSVSVIESAAPVRSRAHAHIDSGTKRMMQKFAERMLNHVDGPLTIGSLAPRAEALRTPETRRGILYEEDLGFELFYLAGKDRHDQS